ncbi:MAG: hypothetical protein O7E54_04895 [Planctomycetota bacterium]|nr:hypothetical protein [Planctomycetota bacterium]
MRTFLLLTGIVALGPLAAVSAESPGAYYKNERWGYKVRTPQDWTHAAMSADEHWIASKHLSKRTIAAKNGWSSRPEMWVIGFPHARERGAKRTKGSKGENRIEIENPYKDYKDFLKRHQRFAGGGYYFSAEKEATIAGGKVTKYEIKVENMVENPYRIVTWVYHFDDIDFAIQFRIFASHIDKYKGTFKTCLKSFRRARRKKSMPGGVTTGKKIVEDVDEDELTPEELKKHRHALFERKLRREVDALPKGWFHMRSKNYVALSNADKKFTKESLVHAEAIRTYLEKTFGHIGDDYVPPGLIRIFNSREEEVAFQQGTKSVWFGTVSPILLTRKRGEYADWEYEYLNGRVTSQWLSFRNRHLDWNMPFWFETGLEQHMKFAAVKGRKVTGFKPDPYDKASLRTMLKQGKAAELMSLFQGNERGIYSLQAGSVVSYLLGKGNRGKWKNSVQNYLKNLIKVIEEEEKRLKVKTDAALGRASENAMEDEDEDEDDEANDGPSEDFVRAFKDKAKNIRKRAFEMTFGEMSEKDWKKLDTRWRDHAG